MTILKVNIENDKDLPILKEILKRFGLKYKVEEQSLVKEDEVLYSRLKDTLHSINDWEVGKTKLESAKDALAEIESELDNEV